MISKCDPVVFQANEYASITYQLPQSHTHRQYIEDQKSQDRRSRQADSFLFHALHKIPPSHTNTVPSRLGFGYFAQLFLLPFYFI